ncbi:MAG: hypothetical protein KIT09_33565 [Bryobacteraceae bacterium]|nr:hypothetical protein [Bryobacteraceae bacterium]
MRRLLATLLSAFATAAAADLPADYFKLLEAGAAMVEKRLAAPGVDLKTIEADGRWRHFPYAILAPAVLYAKKHPANPRFEDARMLELALRIGDLLASEDEKGTFEPRLDSDWDTYMWMETYRLLEPQLGEKRKARWRQAIERNVAVLVEDATDRLDFAWYHSPFIGTSPNHYALWASNLHMGGRLFGKPEWERLGQRILQRFATVEQTPDGYWGEHNRYGPTPGYNHLTLTAVALYWEHTNDDLVMPALRRAMDFHKNFTFLDATPVDVLNDRNRHWGVSAWGQFAFTHWPDGRGYAGFLAGFFQPETLTVDQLGRLAQDALYYHEGPSEPAPQQTRAYQRQMSIPAGIRKTGPWQVALSGIINTQAVNNRFYLDRQGHISVFHEKLGLIVTGANSKRQPELATFSETIAGETIYMPISSRLQMSDREDRLSLAFNTYFSDLYVPAPSDRELTLRFDISGRGRPSESPRLTLQIRLEPGETLETGGGRSIRIGAEKIELGGAELAGSIRHRGWTMAVVSDASLTWPVFPHNPYADSPETNLRYAVAALSVPLKLKEIRGKYVRPHEQEIVFRLRAAP